MSHKFIGSLCELQKIIEKEGVNGVWRHERLYTGGIKHIFKSEDSGVLTFWESTGTILCQGKTKESQKLFDIISKYLVEANSFQKNELTKSDDI